MRRIILHHEPFPDPCQSLWNTRGEWPAQWIDLPERPSQEPSTALFRLSFEIAATAIVRIHVSADNRYILYCDNQFLGRGPERGAPKHWHFESYELDLSPGKHTLVSLSWWLGTEAPYAQMSIRPGFLLSAEPPWDRTLSTGKAPWTVCLVNGVSWQRHQGLGMVGGKVSIDGTSFPWGWEAGTGDEWQTPIPIVNGMSAARKNEFPPYWLLTPATLPAMKETPRKAGHTRHLAASKEPYPIYSENHLRKEAEVWDAMLAGKGEVRLPPNTVRCAVIDLNNYFCLYPKLRVSGGNGTRIRLRFAEGLFHDGPVDHRGRPPKGNRDEIENKSFIGGNSEFFADGGNERVFTTFWWECGRYVEVMVKSANEPLVIHELEWIETGYPLPMKSSFIFSDPRFTELTPLAVRALRMCSHETYMDCPYYEQLMYVGDTRIEALTTYALTRDDRLPRKALLCFDHSRLSSGLTQSRYPSRVTQIIPPFSLWYICMLHDYAFWRDDPAFVRDRMPAARAIGEYFRTLMRPSRLMDAPRGWNFTDWVEVPEKWSWGIPPNADSGVSSIMNLQFALALQHKAELETACEEKTLALRDRHLAQSLMKAVLCNFWNEERGLLADDLDRSLFSEHAQCLALLTGLLPKSKADRIVEGLLSDEGLARATVYFTHYLFETYYQLGLGNTILNRLDLWFELRSKGFRTTPEKPEPSRSDCHAWGAHPLFHAYASFLGIRPVAPGFRRVRIAPQPGSLTELNGELVHPRGWIRLNLIRCQDRLRGTVELPEGIHGEWLANGESLPLKPGKQELS